MGSCWRRWMRVCARLRRSRRLLENLRSVRVLRGRLRS